MQVDDRLIKQFLYHALDAGKNSKDLQGLLTQEMLDYVNGFHQVLLGDCQPIELDKGETE